GQLVPGAETTVLQDRPAIALLDCGYGFGHAAMRKATELAVEKALREGVAYVGLVRCTHIGRLGEYTALAARRGVASFVTVPVLTHAVTHSGEERAHAAAIIAVDAAAFGPREALERQVAAVYAQMRGVPTAEGFDEVLIPGEPEARSRQTRLREGIPLPDRTWAELREDAAELG